MKTEDKLDQLFETLRSEPAQFKNIQVQAWLTATSIGTSIKSLSFMAKLKAFLATSFGKVCAGILISMVLVSIIGILASETPKNRRVTVIPNRAFDRVKDSIIEFRISVPNKLSKLSYLKSPKSTSGEVNENSILPFSVEYLAHNLVDIQNVNITEQISQSISQGDKSNWAGVYKTYEDFLASRFCDSIPINIVKNKIYVGSFDRVVIKTAERKTSFKLGSIYGFYDGKNLHRYRLTKSPWDDYGYFTVRESNGLILYSQAQFGYKGTYQTHFYYSIDLNSPIKSLSEKNLLEDFQNTTYIEKVIKTVNRMTNMSQEKWSRSLKEINEVYREYY